MSWSTLWGRDSFSNVQINDWWGSSKQVCALRACVAELKDSKAAIVVSIDLTASRDIPEGQVEMQAAQLPFLLGVGFRHRHTEESGKKSEYWIKNRSTAPLPLSAVTSAFVFPITKSRRVYVVADRGRDGLSAAGGSSEFGELLSLTARREVEEEIGLLAQPCPRHELLTRLCAGLALQPEQTKVLALVNRRNHNKYGAAAVLAFYYAEVADEVKMNVDEHELLGGAFFPLDQLVDGSAKLSTTPAQSPTPLTMRLLAHLKDPAKAKGTSEIMPDIRQLSKPVDQRDASDVMEVYFF